MDRRSPGKPRRGRGAACLACVGGWALLAGLGLPGCRSVPGEKFDNCRRMNDTLRVENAQLRDQKVALATQNQDLSERAVDDARKLRSQEKAIAQLERSVHAYQAERDELEVALKELRQAASESGARLSSRGNDPENH